MEQKMEAQNGKMGEASSAVDAAVDAALAALHPACLASCNRASILAALQDVGVRDRTTLQAMLRSGNPRWIEEALDGLAPPVLIALLREGCVAERERARDEQLVRRLATVMERTAASRTRQPAAADLVGDIPTGAAGARSV